MSGATDSFIFFDLDGTLTDPAEGITACIKYALEAEGIASPSDEVLITFIGPPLQRTFAQLLQTEDQVAVNRATAKYRERFADVGLFENRVYDGIPEALEKLREAGVRLMVATAKPHVYANRILRHFDIAHFFEAVFGPELDGTRTDKTELIRHALAQDKLIASAGLMVGDREHDIIAANNNGMKSLAVGWGYGAREEHERAGADARVDQVADLTQACFKTHPHLHV